MGGFTSKTQQDLKLYLQRDYDVSNYPSIINKINKNKALVHQIITDSTQQAHKVRSDVNMYHHLRCQSISNVLQYIPLQSDKICSEQQYHYIVEQDLQKYNLKHQFLARKYYKQKFSDNQIYSILKTYICGLNVYHQKFERRFADSLNLQSITIDQERFNQLRLVDPLLKGQNTSYSHSLKQKQNINNLKNKQQHIQKVNIRQAPEKYQLKKTKFNDNKIQINQLFADLYQVGIICLQLHRMEVFNQYQQSDILKKQINFINNRQIKKIAELLTHSNPLQRGNVYNFIKLSMQQKYCLQKNLKRGKINSNSVRQNKLLNPNQIQKDQLTFSFGNSQIQPLPSYKVTESFGIHTNQNKNTYQINNTEKNRTATISNLSTDRSINQNPGMIGHSLSNVINYNSKPTIKFSTGNSSVNNFPTVKILSSSSSNLYNHNPTNNNNLYQNNSAILLSKEKEPLRTNSYLFNDKQEKPLFSQSDYSPFKKQQDVSPLSQKERTSMDNNNYKKIFQKYSYLNFQANSGLSPGKTYENQRIQAQINRILRGSINKQVQNNKTQNKDTNNNYLKNNKYSPITVFNSVDSPISALQLNQNQNINPFVTKQNSFINSTNIQNNGYNSQIPAYRPNKQVQEILKRLGIGSLLYGNNQNNGSRQQNGNTQLRNEKFTPLSKSQIEKQDIFVHKVNYNINKSNIKNINSLNENLDVKNSKQNNQNFINSKKADQVDIHDRQTTPIRPVNKAKYNSTIVQVGDEDSQYSSSGVRNLQNFTEGQVDLSNHQFVNQQYQNGSKYEGYKMDGQRNGYGKFYYQDGGYYQGQWKNNAMDGFGRLYYEGGKLAYQGHWAKDQFHGFGKVYNDNPVKLQCGFDFTNFDLLQDYWEYYEGLLVKDTKQGRGKIKLTNDQVFEGDFHNDRIQGFGKFFLIEGKMIQGIWRDSKLIKIINQVE